MTCYLFFHSKIYSKLLQKTDAKSEDKVPAKFAGLLKVWNVMQKTICGKTPPSLSKDRVADDLEKRDFCEFFSHNVQLLNIFYFIIKYI